MIQKYYRCGKDLSQQNVDRSYFILSADSQQIISLKELNKTGIGRRFGDWIYGGISEFTNRPIMWTAKYLFSGRRVSWLEAISTQQWQDGFAMSNFCYIDRNGKLINRDGEIISKDEINGGFYIPTKKEIKNAFLSKKEIRGFKNSWHWSSSEHSIIDAYAHFFGEEICDNYLKTNTSYARGVRSLQHVK